MLDATSVSRVQKAAPFALATFAFLMCFAFAPGNAHAAAVTLVTATTTSNNASTTLAKIGDTVSYQVVLSGTPSATTTPVINIFSMGSTSMSGAGTNWTYSTTTTSSWSNGLINFNIGWGGSAGEATTTITQAGLTSSNVRFDKTAPVLGSLTSTATTTGALKVGDTIIFTVTSASPEVGGSVTGTYNSVPITFSTSDGGTTFVGTYTVVEGQTDQPAPVQFSGITLRDAAGNTASGSTGDVLKTIDANSPAAPTSNVAAGTYTSTQTVTFSSIGSSVIRYTLGGATPTCSLGNIYSGPLTLSISSPFVLIGCDNAGNASGLSSFSYVIQNGGGSFSGSGGGSGGGGSFSSPAPTATVTTTTVTPSVTTSTSITTQATAFTRNLTTGSVGADVKLLQAFLNAHGFPVATTGIGSKGNETNTFGTRTKAALAKFQAAKGITPAAGYFGAKTRALVGGM
ncbi:MAG: baaA1 [Parcubacteria group bacterium]|nr:baaA1 [Parcubacteria group bacterium]